MSLDIFILLFTSLANVILGSIVLSRNYKNKANISFFLITFSITCWTLTNYLTDNTDTLEANLFFARLANVTGFQIVFWILMFSYFYPRANQKIKINKKFTLSVLTLGVILPFLNLTIAGVSGNTGVAHQDLGPLYVLFVVVILVTYWKALVNIRYRYLHTPDATEANRLKYIIVGFTASFVFSMVTNAILPGLTGNWQISRFGPIFSTILAGVVTFTIVKHKLFDIRLFAARTFAYGLLVAALTALYIVVVFGLTERLLHAGSTLSQQIIQVLAALFVAATAPYFKRIFDRATNRFFYRDAYDPQAFLDELNKTLVSNIELGILLRRTAGVIQQNLKSESCFITVRQTDERPFRLLGTDAPKFKADQLAYIYSQMAEMGQKLLIVDDVKLEHSKLKRTLNSGGIALVSAPTGYEKDNPALAYLILGPKKSGNIYSKDDLRLIQIITDELVIAIQNALRFEEIQSFNVTLQAKINEATEQLQRNNKKLQVLDQTKDEFISMASHQLRTPLTSIKGYLSMVLDGDAGQVNEEQRKMLQQAFISSQRMTYLISDLLNVSRLRTGKFFIEKAPTNLATVVQQEVDQLRESAKIRGLELNYDQPANFPTIDLDETKTRQVIMNFIDNAIYYTPSGGRIDVALTNKHKSVELTVTDTGIGIAKKEQHRLFSKFYRAPNAKRARPDGTGLGLFMAKKIIVAQGGAIIFHSQPDKGSTFGFSFPKK